MTALMAQSMLIVSLFNAYFMGSNALLLVGLGFADTGNIGIVIDLVLTILCD